MNCRKQIKCTTVHVIVFCSIHKIVSVAFNFFNFYFLCHDLQKTIKCIIANIIVFYGTHKIVAVAHSDLF